MNKDGYTLLAADYPDFAIEKKTAKTKKTLAVLPSDGSCFILSEKNGVCNMQELNETSYAGFSSGMPDIPLPDGFWVGAVPKGREGARMVLSVFEDNTILDAVRNGCCGEMNSIYAISYNHWDRDSFHACYGHNKELLVALRQKNDVPAFRAVFRNSNLAYTITCLFGLENAVDFFQRFSKSLLCNLFCCNANIPTRDIKVGLLREFCEWETETDKAWDKAFCAKTDIPFIKMDYEKFRDFLLYEYISIGTAGNIYRAISQWFDVLDKQFMVYGKIKEIFPKDFPSVQKRLDSICALWFKSGEFTKEPPDTYNGSDGDYVYTVPHTNEELCVDAVEQRSSISVSFDNFRDGKCIVLFMRLAENPDTPYITAEIRDGELIAAKRPLNKELSVEEHDRLLSWIAEHTG